MTLVHGNRGRPPANRLADERRERLIELAGTTYAGSDPVCTWPRARPRRHPSWRSPLRLSRAVANQSRGHDDHDTLEIDDHDTIAVANQEGEGTRVCVHPQQGRLGDEARGSGKEAKHREREGGIGARQ
ncbi:MAG: hypothetical protein H0V36_10960 [Chloroflexi bacterium]|nr:hypothetical protein [Chloroflexota bacterium]